LKEALTGVPNSSIIKTLEEAEKKVDLFSVMTYLVIIHFIGKVTDSSRATELFTQHEIAPLKSRPSAYEDIQEKFNYEFADHYAAYLRTYLANPILNQIYQEKVKPEELARDVLCYKTNILVLQVAARALVQVMNVHFE
jgi:hypothetical protein